MSNKKIYSLQILRFICFLTVMIAHSGYFQFLSNLAVSVFFVLSGFVLMYSYRDKDINTDLKSLFSFAWSKTRKLFFLNILVSFSILLIELYAIYTGNNQYDLKTTLLYFVLQILLIQTFTPGMNKIDFLNAPSWYFSVSMMLYFFFPLIRKSIKDINKTEKCITCVVLLYLTKFIATYLFRNIPDSTYLLYFSPYFRFFDFIIGCFLLKIYSNISDKEKTGWIYIVTVLLFAALVLVNLGGSVPAWMYYSLQHLPSSVFIVLSFALLNDRIDIKKPAIRRLVDLGDISGYAYMIHSMVVEYIKQLYAHFMGNEINGILLFAVATTATISLSFIYKKYIVEKWSFKKATV